MLEQPVPDAHLDRHRLDTAIAAGNIPTLLMVVHQLTGDRRWLRDPYRPTRTRGLDDHDDGGLAPPAQAEIRAAAVEAVEAWHRGQEPAVAHPTAETLQEMMSTCMGEEVPPEYATMMLVEMGFTERLDAGTTPDGGVDEDRAEIVAHSRSDFSVVVIGAGIAGLIAGARLREAGIPFVILEKNEEVGGTWLENRYPGAGVDTPSFLYSFSFFSRNWSTHFGKRDEVYAYIHDMATHHGLHESTRFGCEVTSARFDDRAQRWTLHYRGRGGATATITANAVITAVGLHNRPRVPDLRGMGSFPGPSFHTARWPDDLDVTGKNIAVIGTGASAMQVVPAVAGKARHVTVFQRSPQWIAPNANYFAPVSEDVRWLMSHVPYYHSWYRFRLAWSFNDKNHAAFQKDPDWPHPERSLNAVNDGHRKFFTAYLEKELDGRPDLVAKALPTYPPFGKRILLDNGWYAALRRDDVTLVTDPVREVTPTGVRTARGEDHDADVLVWSTGFEQQRFLYPMSIVGRDGLDLREVWDDDDARAFLGITTPGFPNLFFTYGPNTNPGGGSTIFILEAQVHYVLGLLTTMLREGLGTIECRSDVHDRYNRDVDAAHAGMIWTHPGMDTYYRNARGRVVTNMPWRVVDYWHMTRRPDLDDYLTTPAPCPTVASAARDEQALRG